jgi:Glycosyl hydrolases family 16
MRKRTPIISAYILCACIFGCSDSNDTMLINKNKTANPVIDLSPSPVGGITPWSRVFYDPFDDDTSFDGWEKTNRPDYNSSICIYDATVPHVSTFEGRTVLALTATKMSDGTYKSGHVKSLFAFSPALNEEYHIVASIKVVGAEMPFSHPAVPVQNARTSVANPISLINYKNFGETYGAWPAFWTTDENGWPTHGETDIMEGYSYGQIGQERFASNLFYGTVVGQDLLGNSAEAPYWRSAALGTGIYVDEGWHTYEAYWKNDNGVVSIRIVVDGLDHTTYTNSVHPSLALENFSDHNIILNLNVGSNSEYIFDNDLINLFDKTMMLVDYVSVYKRNI